MSKTTVLLLSVIVLANIAFWQYSLSPHAKTPAVSVAQGAAKSIPKVLVHPIAWEEDSRIFKAVGTGKARVSASIRPAVSDEVVAVLFSAQQRVKKGEVLVQLDDREEKLALEKATVALNDAQSLLHRYEQAVKKGAVPESEVDSARADFQLAQVAVETAKLAVEERQITAPFDGIVGIPNVDPGDRVDSSTLVTGLDARDILFVDFDVPETLASALQQPDIAVTATTPAYPGKTFHGTIAAQESRLNTERRTLTVRVQINNTEDLLRPGMSFTILWEIPGEAYPAVPEISLQWSREGSYVWTIEDGKAQQVYGRVVSRRGSYVLLNTNIKKGTPVVVEGVQRLRPGITVEILEAGEE